MTTTDRPGGERRLAAIMFTDVVGFSALSQRDEALALRLLEAHRGIVREHLAKHAGREIKTIGDGFLVEFGASLEAVTCAMGIQTAMSTFNSGQPEDERIFVRIGIHLGDVIHLGTDVAGDAVNVASRIESLAPPGGVCVTAAVHSSLSGALGHSFESIGSPPLKNIDAPIEVFRLAGLGSVGAALEKTSANRVAILPFSNISPEAADEYFADGMTEELIAVVSQTRGLHVIARTSMMRYKGVSKPIAEIGRELRAGTVLEGSVRKAGDQIRISVQLIDAASEEPRWSQTYDRKLQDVFSIQSDIAGKVAEALREHVMAGQQPLNASTTTRSTKSYINYLRGRQLWNRRTEPDLRQAITFFEAALRADPAFARAYTGLADTYAVLALLEFMAPRQAFPRAREAVDHALALDADLVDAHTSLALIHFQYDWDWERAEAEFRRAIEIHPGYAPAHQFYADLLKARGRLAEAIAQINQARELDPLSLAINTAVGHVYYLDRQYDRAIQQYQHAVDLDPGFMATHLWFGRPYLEKGLYTDALRELETAVQLSGQSTVALAMLGHGLASAGHTSEAFGILEQLTERAKQHYVPSYWIAVIYNGLHDRDQVIAWLRKAFEERSSWLVWSNVEPRFDWIRSDPDFAALMREMKLV
jgi:class 3 adenylate cyclase/tetratricopeptide (TPR) repeat protein